MAAIGSKGTIKPYSNFNAADDVQKLRAAMKGAGTNEDVIIDIIANRTLAQRQEIKIAYKTSVGKDLEDDLKSELTGNFEKVIIGLLTPYILYDVEELKKAMKGAGTDEGCLIEILASRSTEEIRNINAAYKLKYDKSLEDDICSDTSFMFQRVLVALAAGGRDQGDHVDDALAKKDAQCIPYIDPKLNAGLRSGQRTIDVSAGKPCATKEYIEGLTPENCTHVNKPGTSRKLEELYEAGEKKWGTDEVKFLTILCTRNRKHLLKVFEEYKKVSKKELEASIKSEMSGHLEDALLAIVKCTRSRPAYFAERLYKSMKGLGTDDNTLIRVMVSRCEIDMLEIRSEFKKAYGKSLHSFIKGDCSGDYRKVLLKLCGGED